jgi:hypothetical protein
VWNTRHVFGLGPCGLGWLYFNFFCWIHSILCFVAGLGLSLIFFLLVGGEQKVGWGPWHAARQPLFHSSHVLFSSSSQVHLPRARWEQASALFLLLAGAPAQSSPMRPPRSRRAPGARLLLADAASSTQSCARYRRLPLPLLLWLPQLPPTPPAAARLRPSWHERNLTRRMGRPRPLVSMESDEPGSKQNISTMR